MTTRDTLVIVGAALAGAKAAEGARAAGYDGRVVLLGDEPTAPYERPPLSKAVLRGEADLDSTRVHPDGFYAEHDVELVTGHAVALDAADRRIELDDGAAIAFDRAVLATGAAPRRLGVPGHDLEGVHHLRTAADAVALGGAIRASARVAVIGAGWIGTEVAASARQMGADVVLVAPGPVPLHRVLGPEIGAMFRRLHADNGVSLRLGVGVSELRGPDAVREVVLDDGRVEEADVVVVGIGAVPRTEIATSSPGLRVDDGILVDEHLETTVPGVFAAGDVADAWHPHFARHVRVEHWANALHQGVAAGGNAGGRHDVYGRLPYFFSDQYDLGMEYVGLAEPGDTLVVRGELDARSFVALWHRDGIVTAAMHANVWDVVDDLTALVASRAPIDVDRMADPDVPLAELVPASSG